MQIRMSGFAVATAFISAISAAPAAAQAAPPQTGVKDGIVGSDVMGDRNRTGPDGWSWAPVTRDQTAAGSGAGETAENLKKAPNASTAGPETKPIAPGDDPGTPATADAHGPGTIEKSAGAR